MAVRVLVLRSEPGAGEAKRALQMARSWLEHERALAVALIQDGVLTALSTGELPAQRELRKLVGAGARCVYLADDLARRGFGSTDTLAGAEPVDYDGLAELLLGSDTRVVGAF